MGNDLNVWTYETARKMIRYGHVGVLVDAPSQRGKEVDLIGLLILLEIF